MIEKLINSDLVISLKPKPYKPKDWDSIFKAKYDSFDKVITLAADYMFNLNRYAKHKSCSNSHRDEIYNLKNDFIKYLYNKGFCKSCYIHKDEKECWSCWAYDDFCYECSNTGIFATYNYVVFNFIINEISYTWHQPENIINFKYDLTDNSIKDINETKVKPVNLSKGKLSEAKALIRYLLNNY